MKKIVRFSKLFLLTTCLSSAIIISGFIGIFIRGINFGVDFRSGLITEVIAAPTAVELTYSGSAAVSVDTSRSGVSLVVSGVGAENKTVVFPYASYKTVGELAQAFSTVEGVSAAVKADVSTPVAELFTDSQKSSVLSTVPYALHYSNPDAVKADADMVRDALESVQKMTVKALGAKDSNAFQIRVADDGSDPEMSKKIQLEVYTLLSAKFGEGNIAVTKTDYIGSEFSKSLAFNAVILIIATLVLIWIYAAVRFSWDFALGAVLAILHDALIMFAFIVWTQMEFNSTTIAAILTIIGYSINDTVVVLDRVRENTRLLKVKKFKEILDISQTEILSRTIITTITTMLAVISLFVFTSGSMKDFALALIVGLISGVYSTIYITGAFIALVRKNWKPSDEEKKTQVITVEEAE